MKSMLRVLSIAAVSVSVAACMGAPKIDPTALTITPQDTQVVQIPKECDALYKTNKMSVAVLEFANNTTFGDMTARNTNTTGQVSTQHASAGVVGVVAAPGAVGIGHASVSKTDTQYSENQEEFMRQIAPKIGEFAQGSVETNLVQMGGVDIFSRQQMEKIMREQQFQMTLADPNTAVKFGKLAGVPYIVTGSVDNIAAKYIPPVSVQSNQRDSLGSMLLKLGTQAAVNTQTGWNVNTEMTVSMVDVATGQILFQKKVNGREVAGGGNVFNPEMIITAAKKAMGEAVDDIRPELSKIFEVKGYINELRGGKQAALVSLGTKHGLKAGEKLEVFDFIVSTDFMTKQKKCNIVKLPIEIITSEQVDETQAWVTIKSEKPEMLGKMSVGSLVKRAPLEGQGMLKKIF